MDLDNSSAPPVLRPAYITPAALALIAIAISWLYYWGGDLHRFTQWVAAYIGIFIANFALYLAACYVVLRKRAAAPRALSLATLAVIFVFAATFRLQLVDKRPYLSSDTYRYIWDGRVQAAGINPYRYVPSAPELERLRDDKIYPQINRGDYAPTPYPPIAQAVYFAIYMAYPLSVTAFKVAMSLFDLLALLAVMLALARAGFDPARAVIFAWHPLLIWEGAHSGHIESAFIAFLALALLARSYNKAALTGAALALATLTKFYPALLLPAFMFSKPQDAQASGAIGGTISGVIKRAAATLVMRENVVMMVWFVVVVVGSYVPYLSVGAGVLGYLPREMQEEGYVEEGERYFLLYLIHRAVALPTSVFIIAAALALSGFALWVLLRHKRDAADVARWSAALIALFLMLATPRYPWYYAWLIPYLCFFPRLAWLYLTGATVLLYLTWYTPSVYPEIPLWLGAAVYAPTVALLVRESWSKKNRLKAAAGQP